MTLAIFYLCGKSTMGYYKPLPLEGTPSSVFNDFYNQQNIFLMELYNTT